MQLLLCNVASMPIIVTFFKFSVNVPLLLLVELCIIISGGWYGQVKYRWNW